MLRERTFVIAIMGLATIVTALELWFIFAQ